MKESAMLRHLVVALLACIAPAAALAQEADKPPAPEAEKPKDPIVCKRVQQSHTRISSSQRTCLPKSQWDLQSRELDEMQRRNNQLRPNAQG
jgi:hypothetical protein